MKKLLKLLIPVVIIIAIIVLGVKYISKPQPTNSDDAILVSENEDLINGNENATDLIKFNYEFNPHVISKEYLTIYGADIEETFYDFCDAVLNGESTFKCASKEEYNAVLDISRICLPITSAYVDDDKVNVKNGVGHITYKITTEELLKKVEEILSIYDFLSR